MRFHYSKFVSDTLLWCNKDFFSQFGWLDFFNDYLEGSSVHLRENDKVIVRDFEYISQVLRLIDTTPLRVLGEYLTKQGG